MAQDHATAVGLADPLAAATAAVPLVDENPYSGKGSSHWVRRELKLASTLAALHGGDHRETLAAIAALLEGDEPAGRRTDDRERVLGDLAAVAKRAVAFGGYDLPRLVALRPVFEAQAGRPAAVRHPHQHWEDSLNAVVLQAIDPAVPASASAAWFGRTVGDAVRPPLPPPAAGRVVERLREVLQPAPPAAAAPLADRLRVLDELLAAAPAGEARSG